MLGWSMGGQAQESASRELSSPQKRSFLPEVPVSAQETNSDVNAAWPDRQDGG